MKSLNIACIFARGGSKGVPRKNIRMLMGKPLIAYSIEAALSSDLIDRVIVSTDDSEIADISRKFGAEVPFMRPKELALDDTPEWLAWRHAIIALDLRNENDIFISIPPTSPMRSVEDIDKCINLLLNSDADIVITIKTAARNPYFNMVTINSEGYIELSSKSNRPIYRRQDAPPVFDITTVAYAVRPEFILSSNSIFDGRVKAVVVPEERAIDIDTTLDFEFAEFLISKKNQV
jgi:N,N'-diacetyl-8-epilegionaminate cytidylyltransferase